jgi:hypothetical protein
VKKLLDSWFEADDGAHIARIDVLMTHAEARAVEERASRAGFDSVRQYLRSLAGLHPTKGDAAPKAGA